MHRYKFSKSVRLLRSSEFDRVFRFRRSASDGLVIVYVAHGDGEQPRLGLTVSRKCGNAVLRNRWKRSLREAFRLAQHELPRYLDIVVLPVQGAVPDVSRLPKSLIELSAKLADRMPSLRPPNSALP